MSEQGWWAEGEVDELSLTIVHSLFPLNERERENSSSQSWNEVWNIVIKLEKIFSSKSRAETLRVERQIVQLSRAPKRIFSFSKSLHIWILALIKTGPVSSQISFGKVLSTRKNHKIFPWESFHMRRKKKRENPA